MTTLQVTQGQHRFSTDGLSVSYHVYGCGPVCIAHSGGPGIEWSYLRSPALERFLTMVYFEPLGTGTSDRLAEHPAGYSLDRYAACLQALIEHLDTPRPLVLGHSHGGFVAITHALAYPDQTGGLILYDTAPAAGMALMQQADQNIRAYVARNAHHPEVEGVLGAWTSIASMDSDAAYEEVLRGIFPAYFHDYWSSEPTFGAIRSSVRATLVQGSSTPFDASHALDKIDIPALIVVGEDDFICGPRWADELHAGIKRSSVIRLARSGHFGHLEEPERFAEAIRAFVATMTSDQTTGRG